MTAFVKMQQRSWLLSVLLVMFTAAVYWPGLSGEWIFDDYPNIVSNPRVQPDTLSWESIKTAAQGYAPGVYGRPLATIWFALDYLAGGKNPWVFKLSSLLVHLVNAVLVFLLLRNLLTLPRAARPEGWNANAAFAIALLWAVHPLQVSTVLYVVQRMETLSLMFVLLALWVYLAGRKRQIDDRGGWPWVVGSLLLAGLGMLSKETAILFPAYALILELTLLGFEARNPRTQRLLRATYVGGVLAALAGFVFWVIPLYANASAFIGRDFTLIERLLTQLRVLPMYLGQILVPLPENMTFYYDSYPKSTGLLQPATTLSGGILIALLLGCACWLRNKVPLVALGIGWFFAAHLLTSNVFNLELVFEHRNYFALLGILIAVAEIVRRIPMRDGPAFRYVAAVVFLIGLGFLTVVRSSVWGNPMLLAMDLVSKNLSSARASSDMATFYVGMSDGKFDSPFYSLGRQEFERGAFLPGSSPLPEQGLILMAASVGQPVEVRWWERLLHKLRTQPIGVQEVAAVEGLARQRFEGVELDDVRLGEAYATLAARGVLSATTYLQYADYAYTFLQDPELASRLYATAIERRPTDAAFASRVVRSLFAQGRQAQAGAVLKRAEELGLVTVDTPS